MKKRNEININLVDFLVSKLTDRRMKGECGPANDVILTQLDRQQ